MSNDALQEENLDRSYDLTDLAIEQAKDIAKDWELAYQDEIKELKQQLAEKEKEITVLKEVIDKNKTSNFTSENVCNAISKFYEPLLKQLQNQKAIDELETLKGEFEKYEKIFKLRPVDVYTIIEQQIKSLKGDSNDKRKTNDDNL